MMLHYRKYASTEDYARDQGSKVRDNLEGLKAKSDRKYDEFLIRFRDYVEYLSNPPTGYSILCLGARLGEEVLAFRRLGFLLSVGIDLNPIDSKVVAKGNWNDLPYIAGTFQAVYTNSVDHASSIARFSSEVSRVLLPDGVLIIELLKKHSRSDKSIEARFNDGFHYESMLWNREQDVLDGLQGFTVIKDWHDKRWGRYVLKRDE